MKVKCKKEMEIGTNPILQVDTNSIFDVSYEIDDEGELLHFGSDKFPDWKTVVDYLMTKI